MSSLVYGADEFVAQWAMARLPMMRVGFGACVAIGVAEANRLIAAIVYYNYRPSCGSIEMAVAAERGTPWCSRQNLSAFFDYPFRQLQCRSIHIACARNNRHAKKFVARIGFKPAGLLRRGFGTADAVLYDMLPDECRWLRNSNGQRQPIAAARA